MSHIDNINPQSFLIAQKDIQFIFRNYKEQDQSSYKKFHYSLKSGIKIGYNFDFKLRYPSQIQSIFQNVCDQKTLKLFKLACGKQGKKKQKFCQQNINFSITQQLFQFIKSYELLETIRNSQQKFTQNLKNFNDLKQDLLQIIPHQFKTILYDLSYQNRLTNEILRLIIPNIEKYLKVAGSHLRRMQISGLKATIRKCYLTKIHHNDQQIATQMIQINQFLDNQNQRINQYLNSSHFLLKFNQNSINLGQQREEVENAKLLKSSQQNLGHIQTFLKENLNQSILKKKFKGIFINRQLFALQNSQNALDVTLEDLIVPLKILTDEKITNKNISISLDPLIPTQPNGPLYQKVYYPLELEGTPMGNAMIQADYIMKQLNLGCDQNNKPFLYPESLKQIGMQAQKLVKQFHQYSEITQRNRLWIIILDIKMQKDQNIIRVKDVKMGINVKRQQVGQNGILQDSQVQISAHKKKFIQLFTDHYQTLAKQYPVFQQIKRYTKAIAYAKAIVQNNCFLDIHLINYLYDRIKKPCSKSVNRLSHTIFINQIQTQTHKQRYSSTLSGGCVLNLNNCQSFNIDNLVIDSKYLLDQKINSQRNIANFLMKSSIQQQQQKKLSNQNVMKQKIKSSLQLKPEHKFQQLQIQKSKISCLMQKYLSNQDNYPNHTLLNINQKWSSFLFQKIEKCKFQNCQNTVVNNKYSNQNNNKFCSQHHNHICGQCKFDILPGQSYSVQEGFNSFHMDCLVCQYCYKKFQQQQKRFRLDNFLYHQQCYPHGKCDFCNEIIRQSNGGLYTFDGQNVHSNCFEKWKNICSSALNNMKQEKINMIRNNLCLDKKKQKLLQHILKEIRKSKDQFQQKTQCDRTDKKEKAKLQNHNVTKHEKQLKNKNFHQSQYPNKQQTPQNQSFDHYNPQNRQKKSTPQEDEFFDVQQWQNSQNITTEGFENIYDNIIFPKSMKPQVKKNNYKKTSTPNNKLNDHKNDFSFKLKENNKKQTQYTNGQTTFQDVEQIYQIDDLLEEYIKKKNKLNKFLFQQINQINNK